MKRNGCNWFWGIFVLIVSLCLIFLPGAGSSNKAVESIPELNQKGQTYVLSHEPFVIKLELTSNAASTSLIDQYSIPHDHTFKYFAAKVTIYYPNGWDVIGIDHGYYGLDTSLKHQEGWEKKIVPPGHAFVVTTKVNDREFQTWELKLDNTFEFVGQNERFRVYPANPIVWLPMAAEAESSK